MSSEQEAYDPWMLPIYRRKKKVRHPKEELAKVAQFYSVIGNRDHLKIKGEDIIKEPIWKFIEGQSHWLTSLVYIKNMLSLPPGKKFLDCGAWSYKNSEFPKWSPSECINLYKQYASPGDIVTAPDHMVLRGHDEVEEKRRISISIKNAKEFIKLCPKDLVPIAATHGNSISLRINMTKQLLGMGYRHIAIGGVAGIAGSRKVVTQIIEETCKLREKQPFYIHVLGISALSWIPTYEKHKIDSYDGSAMFYAAFTGATYYNLEGGKIIKYSVKDLDKDQIPICNCSACVPMREQGDDTRTMGCNERNMGRATHNINTYLKALGERHG